MGADGWRENGAYGRLAAADRRVLPPAVARYRAHLASAPGRYILLDGRARFALDGAVVDAPAGTIVRVPPGVHRAATEVPATVLAFGGPPEFEPAGGERVERARPFVRSDPERARRVLDAGAREHLGRALAAEPGLTQEAVADPGLAPLLEGLR
jgi:hypothetical protein